MSAAATTPPRKVHYFASSPAMTCRAMGCRRLAFFANKSFASASVSGRACSAAKSGFKYFMRPT